MRVVNVPRLTQFVFVFVLRAFPFSGAVDGSLTTLTYVDETAAKRLHLLQGQLIRTVQHVAALNPKAFR